eukprot:TRINITY_DN2019_c0_g1_i1.p1 TRINITY_DN2019_c0_g1~~TRINITY_DN2019_c0_g1_i1.p1  ORF type:complete len:141 (+),score=35.94 TRINITY_DN2019_c0_g1_i1:59-424(+)
MEDDFDLEQNQSLFQEPEDFLPPDPQPSFQTFTRANGSELNLRLPAKHSLWAHCLWNAGKYLADKFDNPEFCKGKRFLELGAGAGLPSIICALNGAETVVITDYPDQRLIENTETAKAHRG